MPATFLWQHATIRSVKEMVMTAATERRAQRSQNEWRNLGCFSWQHAQHYFGHGERSDKAAASQRANGRLGCHPRGRYARGTELRMNPDIALPSQPAETYMHRKTLRLRDAFNSWRLIVFCGKCDG